MSYISRTAAKGSAKRAALRERGGRVLVPYLVDADRGVEMYQSEDIIDYLNATYGRPRARLFRWISPLNSFGAALASAVRPLGRHSHAAREQQPKELLQLYNMEWSPYCRKVREALNELDLDHVVHNVGTGSPRREQLVARGGKMLVPYLVDPNRDIEMYESDDIVQYLQRTYGS